MTAPFLISESDATLLPFLKSDGTPKNWYGKDWPTYKWAMKTVFEENQLEYIVDETITDVMLKSATAKKQKEFNLTQANIKRMIGTSVLPDILQQFSDKMTG